MTLLVASMGPALIAAFEVPSGRAIPEERKIEQLVAEILAQAARRK